MVAGDLIGFHYLQWVVILTSLAKARNAKILQCIGQFPTKGMVRFKCQ